ncbi:MAG: ligase-associated DNA damage response endonuclease PdeM [Proteobacteria bacterium]|nr:ligase-associated DNA damage response endonuclease PdeM [Pseudomonadota bacterium]
MGARVTVNQAGLLADPAGALVWPEHRCLVVADLHLEKGSSYAAHGRMLPPYDTRTTLARLAALIRHYRPSRVVCLGDSFHDRKAAARLPEGEAAQLKRLVVAQRWTWIAGNHDPVPPTAFGGEIVDELTLGPLCFRHQPVAREHAAGEVCGHLHPKAALSVRGRRISGPCFVTDGRRIVLPAFGAYAGGLDVLDPAIASLFGRGGFRVLMPGRDRVHAFTRDRLSAFSGTNRLAAPQVGA